MKLSLFCTAEGANVDLSLALRVRKETTENIWVSIEVCIEILCADIGRSLKARWLPFLLGEFGGLSNVIWPMSKKPAMPAQNVLLLES